MSDCNNGNSCNTSESKSCCHQHEHCCPVDMAIEKWSCSFCEAMGKVQVEILKEKIRKNWGADMEKVADAIMEAKGADWGSALAHGKTHMTLREKVKNIFNSEKK